MSEFAFFIAVLTTVSGILVNWLRGYDDAVPPEHGFRRRLRMPGLIAGGVVLVASCLNYYIADRHERQVEAKLLGIEQTASNLRDATSSIGDATTKIGNATDRIGKVTDRIDTATAQIGTATGDIRSLTQANTATLNNAQRSLTAANATLSSVLGGVQKVEKDTAASATDVKKSVERLGQLTAMTADNLKLTQNVQQNIGQSADRIDKSVDIISDVEAKVLVHNLNNSMHQLQVMTEDELERHIFTTCSNGHDFAQMIWDSQKGAKVNTPLVRRIFLANLDNLIAECRELAELTGNAVAVQPFLLQKRAEWADEKRALKDWPHECIDIQMCYEFTKEATHKNLFEYKQYNVALENEIAQQEQEEAIGDVIFAVPPIHPAEMLRLQLQAGTDPFKDYIRQKRRTSVDDARAKALRERLPSQPTTLPAVVSKQTPLQANSTRQPTTRAIPASGH